RDRSRGPKPPAAVNENLRTGHGSPGPSALSPVQSPPTLASMARLLDPTVLDDVLAFCARFGIRLYDWQRDAFGEACRRADGRFLRRLAGISVPRGNGKSFGGAVVGLWRLLCGPAPQDIISSALDLDGARVVLDHAKRIIRAHPALASTIEVQAGAL